MKRVTVPGLMDKKERGEKITMLTCYDATFARILDEAEVDVMLVGDSLGMVILGEDNTLRVRVEDIAHHTRSVARGTRRAHIVADMPFLSYHGSADEAVVNAGRLLQAGGHSVKLEGGQWVEKLISRMVASGIPVMGHIGLLPQRMHAQGGYRVQGRDPHSRAALVEDALAVEEAGAFAVVLEGVPTDVAAEITERLKIPTIGIGAGDACDGQVLVLYDILGLNPDFKPRFVKHFAPGRDLVLKACRSYVDEVRSGTFPDAEHSFGANTSGKKSN
jgi:3-methyl-2-oxobutanoate hydroxymethyltransferase